MNLIEQIYNNNRISSEIYDEIDSLLVGKKITIDTESERYKKWTHHTVLEDYKKNPNYVSMDLQIESVNRNLNDAVFQVTICCVLKIGGAPTSVYGSLWYVPYDIMIFEEE